MIARRYPRPSPCKALATGSLVAGTSGIEDNSRFLLFPAQAPAALEGDSMPAYQHVTVPTGGQKITVKPNFSLEVPDQPIVPYIEGDGTGVDITPVMIKVVDAAVAKAYGGKRKIHWMGIYVGEKTTQGYGADGLVSGEKVSMLQGYVRSVQGAPSTP